MYTLNISLVDYELLTDIANTKPKVDIMATTDWIKKNKSVVTLHFSDWDALDKFMAYVDIFESSVGMDTNQDNLTATGIRLQKIYDAAHELGTD